MVSPLNISAVPALDITDNIGGGIVTDLAAVQTPTEVYQQFTSLGVSTQPLPQGDATIRISPFDDYFLFTLYQDPSSGDLNIPIPIDLTGVGSMYISFIGENDEIRIPYHTQVAEVDMASGQVLFRISKNESKKILVLDNDNFYISSLRVDKEGNAVSDESVLYTGKFLKLTDEAQQSMTEKYDTLLALSIERETSSQAKIAQLIVNINTINQTIENKNNIIITLNNSNTELSNELSDLTADSTSASITAAQNAATAIQAAAQASITITAQASALAQAHANANASSNLCGMLALEISVPRV